LFLKEGAIEIVAWGGGESELLVEIVNPIPAEALEFQNYEETMTEEQVSPRAGQRLGKVAL
jgi:hypothetical protein